MALYCILRSTSLGMPALAIYNCGNAIFSAAVILKWPLRYSFIAGIFKCDHELSFSLISATWM